jgi:hypothetical protein
LFYAVAVFHGGGLSRLRLPGFEAAIPIAILAAECQF